MQRLLLVIATDATPVNITPKRQCAKLRTCNGEAACPDKWVIHQLPGGCERQVRRNKRQLRIHGRGADIPALFEVQLLGQIARTAGQVAAKEVTFWIRGAERGGVPFPVLEDGEFLVGAAHDDGASKAEVGERVDDSDFLVGVPRALVRVDAELEGAGHVLVPEMGRGAAHLRVHVVEGRAVAPELVDGHDQDGAPDEAPCGIDRGKFGDAKGGLGWAC